MKSERLDWPQTIGALHRQARCGGWSDADLAALLRAHDAVVPLFVGWRRASGRCFTCHLVGTASLVLEFGGEPDHVVAALCHAVFDEGAYGRAGGRHRAKAAAALAKCVSTAAADLAARYSSFDWPRFVAASERELAAAMPGVDASIVRIRIVNEIDDSLDWPFFTEASRASGTRELTASEKIARVLGWEALAARAAFVAEEMGKAPPATALQRHAAYFVAPARMDLPLRFWLRQLLRRVQRAMGLLP